MFETPNPLEGLNLVSYNDAGKALGVEVCTIAHYVKVGKLPKPHRVGKRPFFRLDEFKVAIDKLMNK